MKKLKWIAGLLAVLMVLAGFAGGYLAVLASYISENGTILLMKKISSVCITMAAALAIVLAWLSAKMEKPKKTLGIAIGIPAGVLLLGLTAAVLIEYAQTQVWYIEMLIGFLLVLLLLLVIIGLIGGMIRRHLSEEE